MRTSAPQAEPPGGNMHSTIVKDREQAARELVTTLQLHGTRVGAKLAEIFEPLLEDGETVPDYVLLQRLMARVVRAELADLLAADAAHLTVTEQLEEDGEQSFLRARQKKTEAERQEAIVAFDETYFGFGKMLEALYLLAGEDEIAELLRPRALAGAQQPEAHLAKAELPEPGEEPYEDQVRRRILSRKPRRPGLSRWLGVRIFRRHRP